MIPLRKDSGMQLSKEVIIDYYKQKCKMAWILTFLFFLTYNLLLAESESKNFKDQLEKEVKELLRESSVDQRSDVEKIFKLADIYNEEGQTQKAADLYHSGLKVESWNYAYQMKHARLLESLGDNETAIEKARLVYRNAENETIIMEADDFLEKHGIRMKPAGKRNADEQNKKIIFLVPLGSVNSILLKELEEELEQFLDLNFVILKNDLDMGLPDRANANRIADRIFNNIKNEYDEVQFEFMVHYWEIELDSLETYTGKKIFILQYCKQFLPEAEWKEILDTLQQAEKEGQYNAKRLQELVQSFYYKDHKNTNEQVIGLLGITDRDIYEKDYNFLFGWAGKRIGVMSYHRFTGDFNDSQPSRPRLLKRTTKQALSSTMFIMGIPRCSMPNCVRAYPHSLEEHDIKNLEFCESCKKVLKEKGLLKE